MRKIILLALLMFAFSSSYSQKAFVGSIVGKLKGVQWDHKVQDSTVITTFKINSLAYQEYVKKNIDEVVGQFSAFVSVIVPWGLMEDGKSYQCVYNVASGAVGIFYYGDSQLVQFMWHLADFPGSGSKDYLKTINESATSTTTTTTSAAAPATIITTSEVPASTATTIQTSGEYEYSLPIMLGDSKEKVMSIYGEPDRSADYFQSFFNHGLVIRYENNKVNSIKATLMATDIVYTGKIFGIKVGDNIVDCRRLWGTELKYEKTTLDYDNVTWAYQGYLLKLEIWNEKGKQKGFGSYVKGQVKNIELTK